MVAKVERINGVLKSMRIECDHPGCLIAPSDKEIMEAGGLRNMGWLCSGGRHLCPVHREGEG